MLKKIIRWVVVVILVLSSKEVYAKKYTDTFTTSYISNYSYVDSNGKWGNFQRFYRSDGTIAYCIEPGVGFSTGSYSGLGGTNLDSMATFVNLSSDVLEKVSLIAYYGYGYGDHTGDDWIVATQALIWKVLGREFNFTSQVTNLDPSTYVAEDHIIETPSVIVEHISELESLVGSFYADPDFGDAEFKTSIYGTISADAINNSLDGYKVYKCINCSASLSDNNLTISTNEGNGYVSLKKELKNYSASFVVYNSSEGQDMLVVGNVFPRYYSVNYETVSGTITVNKYDAETKSCERSLMGTSFSVFMNGGYMYDVIVDSTCTAFISGLRMGTYTIVENNTTSSYILNKTEYDVTLSLDSPNASIDVYNEKKKGLVSISKLDSDTNSCSSNSSTASLSGAIYGVYNSSDELITKVTIGDSCNGSSERVLSFGDYYIQEISSPIGYTLDTTKYEFSVNSSNVDNSIEITVYDKVYENEFKIVKNYVKNNQSIREENAKFVVYEGEKVITSFVTDSKGEYSLVLPYGEYVLKQVEGIDGYRYVNDTELIVNESSIDTEIVLNNLPFRGSVQILKVDKKSGVSLSGAIFNVCNSDNYCYQGTTDINGLLLISDLEYGDYTVEEVSAPNNYNINNNVYKFSISYDNEVSFLKIEDEEIIEEVINVEVPSTDSINKNYGVLILSLFIVLRYFKKWRR